MALIFWTLSAAYILWTSFDNAWDYFPRYWEEISWFVLVLSGSSGVFLMLKFFVAGIDWYMPDSHQRWYRAAAALFLLLNIGEWFLPYLSSSAWYFTSLALCLGAGIIVGPLFGLMISEDLREDIGRIRQHRRESAK